MPEIPAPPPEGGPDGDKMAQQEKRFVLDRPDAPDLLHRQRLIAELRTVLYWGVRMLVVIGALLVASLIVIWGWHIGAPAKWRWLTVEDLHALQTVIFSGAVSALITSVASKAI
jgi:hypothetical protein